VVRIDSIKDSVMSPLIRPFVGSRG